MFDHWSINLIVIKVEAFKLDNSVKIGKLLHYFLPLLSTDRIANHIILGHEIEEKSFLEAHVETANYSGGAKLPSILGNLINFIANCIAAFDDEEHLKALVELLLDKFMLNKESCLQTPQYLRHEPCISIIIFKRHKWKVNRTLLQSVRLLF